VANFAPDAVWVDEARRPWRAIPLVGDAC